MAFFPIFPWHLFEVSGVLVRTRGTAAVVRHTSARRARDKRLRRFRGSEQAMWNSTENIPGVCCPRQLEIVHTLWVNWAKSKCSTLRRRSCFGLRTAMTGCTGGTEERFSSNTNGKLWIYGFAPEHPLPPRKIVPAAALPAVTCSRRPAASVQGEGIFGCVVLVCLSDPERETTGHSREFGSSVTSCPWPQNWWLCPDLGGGIFPSILHAPFLGSIYFSIFRIRSFLSPQHRREWKRLELSQRRDPSLSTSDIKAARSQASKSPLETAELPRGC